MCIIDKNCNHTSYISGPAQDNHLVCKTQDECLVHSSVMLSGLMDCHLLYHALNPLQLFWRHPTQLPTCLQSQEYSHARLHVWRFLRFSLHGSGVSNHGGTPRALNLLDPMCVLVVILIDIDAKIMLVCTSS